VAIYYGCPDKNYPVGGIRSIYRHVDILNRHGVDAFVLHHYFPFRCTWFANTTRVAHEVRYPALSRSLPARLGRQALRALRRPPDIDPVPALELTPDDVLVAPEVMPALPAAHPRARVAVFNQSGYLTLAPYPLDVDPDEVVYSRPGLLGVIVVSEDSRRYVETLFANLRVRRLHYGVDPTLFAFGPKKKRQLAYMPRRNPRDVHQVLLRLRLTGALSGWDVVEISHRSEAETAAILRESAVFLSSGHPEGFGLPAAEAMLAGCIVVGYHGNGGREFLTEGLAFPVAHGDIVAFTETVAAVLEQLDTRPDELRARAKAASQFIAETYSPEREEHDLVTIWTELIGDVK
jgi:glycosyltransferase involved in cell wall biosynthesis